MECSIIPSGNRLIIGIPNIFSNDKKNHAEPLEAPLIEGGSWSGDYCKEGAELLLKISKLAPVIRMTVSSPYVLEVTICSGCNAEEAKTSIKRIFENWNIKPKEHITKPVLHQARLGETTGTHKNAA